MTKNLTQYIPILVKNDEVSGKYIIYDGQGRFIACKELGLPIHFIVCNELEESDMILLNISQEKWKPMDYLRHYANKGLQDYIDIQNILQECEEIMVGYILHIWQSSKKIGGKDVSTTETFRQGKYTFPAHAAEKVRAVNFVMKKIKSVVEPKMILNRGSMVRAISSLYILDVDLQELTRQIERYPFIFRPQADQSNYKAHFEFIYNYKKSANNRISLGHLEVMQKVNARTSAGEESTPAILT